MLASYSLMWCLKNENHPPSWRSRDIKFERPANPSQKELNPSFSIYFFFYVELSSSCNSSFLSEVKSFRTNPKVRTVLLVTEGFRDLLLLIIVNSSSWLLPKLLNYSAILGNTMNSNPQWSKLTVKLLTFFILFLRSESRLESSSPDIPASSR